MAAMGDESPTEGTISCGCGTFGETFLIGVEHCERPGILAAQVLKLATRQCRGALGGTRPRSARLRENLPTAPD